MIPLDPLIPGGVAARAAETPAALAVSAPDGALSYAQLDARAARLADRLHDLGVGPDAVVAVCLPRSTPFVVATLGVLKAGAAYLPLDPSWPSERLALTLADCGPHAVIDEPAGGCVTPDGPWAEIDVREPLVEDGPARQHDVPRDDHLACVVYASGSTGVEVTHGSLASLAAWHRRAFAITPADRAYCHASPACETAAWETWPYLMAGASIHLAPDHVRADAGALRDWMLAERISVGFVPGRMAERMLTLRWPARPPLRALLTSTERLHRTPSASLPFALVNHYGAAECTVMTMSGWPIDNVEALVLDEARRPVPAGTAGELYIGGAGLARGYRHRADLTAERFVPHPLVPGTRLYRTGERARLLPDGTVALLGGFEEAAKAA